MDLDAEERKFLDENYLRFGSGWAGGLAMLEKDFSIEVVKKPGLFRKAYELELTTRGPERVTFHQTIMTNGAMSSTVPTLPKGPSFDEAATARFEAALRDAKELWLIESLNDDLRVMDVTAGISSVTGTQRWESRTLDGTDVVYVWESEFWDIFCVAIERGAIVSARWVELPANGSRILTPETIEFLDRAFKTHGDFGVYGSVAQGLRTVARVENFRLRIHRDGDDFGISLTPKDGHGHFLHFPVFADGTIGPCAAGHLIPSPRIDD